MARELMILPRHIQLDDVIALEEDGYQVVSVNGFKTIQEALDYAGPEMLVIKVHDATLTTHNRLELFLVKLDWWPVYYDSGMIDMRWRLGYYAPEAYEGIFYTIAELNRLPSGQWSWILLTKHGVGGLEPSRQYAKKAAYKAYQDFQTSYT